MEYSSKYVKRGRPRTTGAIVAAATDLFLRRGYVGTTVAAIATEAGVAVQTIYNTFGSKRDVLAAVVTAGVSGDEERPPRELVRAQALRAGTGREMLRVAVSFWLGVRPRSEPLFAVVRQAAAVDPEIAALEQDLDAEKLRSMHVVARDLADRGWLRESLDVEAAAAILSALSHPASHRLLVGRSRWDEERYASWLEDSLAAALLRDRA